MAQNLRRPETVYSWIKDNPELIFDPASNIIFCTKCETQIKVMFKGNIDRHIKGAIHQGIQNRQRNKDEFYFDFIEFLILCNIPWSQVSNPAFQNFINKYMCLTCCCICTKNKTPSESLLRKHYFDKFFNMKLSNVYNIIGNNKIWISVDETTDYLGRCVVNLVVMPLIENMATRPYLIACKMLETVNGETISNFVMESLQSMWGESYEEKLSNVLMLCTDSVAYMLRAGRLLNIDLPNMIHTTCLTHALNIIAEKVRSQYKNVDSFIANVKKIFLKSPNRIKILKDMYPDLPLPPEPVITRWGTWLKAATYYAKYFDEISNVLSSLDSSDAVSIKKAKDIIQSYDILQELNYIDEHFSIIHSALTKLQTFNLTINESLQIIDEVRAVLSWTNKEPILEKMENVFDRNPCYDIVRDIHEQISKGIETGHNILYKFAPLTSVDVERSFSAYKWILSDKRNKLKPENIEKIMIVYFNSLHQRTTDESV